MVTVMVLSMSACVAPVAQEAAPAEEKAVFTGKYIVNAQYVMDHMKDENVLIVDARGEDAAKGGTVEGAAEIGSSIGKMAQEKGVTKVVFDRGGHLYHGRVKALADAAREAGLVF